MKNNLLLACCAGLLVAGTPLVAETLTALGRVLPRSGIVDVSGVPGDIVVELRAPEGATVEAGQSLARLSSSNEAVNRLARAEADLATLRTTTQQDLAVAQARVEAADAESKSAEDRFARINSARESEFISPDQIEQRTLGRLSSRVKLLEARQALDAARRETGRVLQAAEAEVAAARAQLALAEVRSPIKGQVLKTLARQGGQVGRQELFKLADTSEMIVIAEVYEADALKVKTGQKVTVSSAALPKKMSGTVTSISQLIYRNSLHSMDPNQNNDSRIVEVIVRMDEASPLDRLVFLQVDVVIDL